MSTLRKRNMDKLWPFKRKFRQKIARVIGHWVRTCCVTMKKERKKETERERERERKRKVRRDWTSWWWPVGRGYRGRRRWEWRIGHVGTSCCCCWCWIAWRRPADWWAESAPDRAWTATGSSMTPPLSLTPSAPRRLPSIPPDLHIQLQFNSITIQLNGIANRITNV